MLAVSIALQGGINEARAEFSGSVSVEQRYFLQDAIYTAQPRAQSSVALSPEWFTEWSDGDNTLVFKPFYRFDQEDSERTHYDIRELIWTHLGQSYEFRAGVGKVFWGQTESLHLVDIINQTDLVDAIDFEAKLGQPMVSFSYYFDAGTLSAFVLPYFRERTFSGVQGRLRPMVPISNDVAFYESDDEQSHVDYALRWQQSIGDWEIGLSYFTGTNREPLLINTGSIEAGDLELFPYYELIDQYGIDLLWVNDSWLYKFEGIHRESETVSFFAGVAGLEYTWVGALGSNYDLGWLIEYQYDERDSNFFVPSQNDLMLGVRWVWNDFDSTEILFGFIQDLDNTNSYNAYLEASTRMTENWKWTMNGYFFATEDIENPYYFIRRDDHVEFNVEFFF
ncbi:hypothetical protein BFC17_21020 [Alteromonas lipolytica]|uniref:Porin domain-containing protein n=1 Tax=Alteromonas lipolytica TaxID=1856405 RepID=A0A1E8FEA1_9ALTE|nr:hypothetical protein BFC17_21020 [Alteromonas lipolytica]